MRRRDFIKLLGSAGGAWPLTVLAQQSDRKRLIGMLIGYAESDPSAQSLIATFRSALAKLGWTEENLRIEIRWTGADAERIRTLAKELVDLRPDAILSHTSAVTSALAHETRTIPIVFVTVADPIASGFVASLARPGGNVTGFTVDISAQGGKWVQLLKEVAPNVVRMALMWNAETATPLQLYMPAIQTAASSLAIEVSVAPVRTKEEIEGVIAAQARDLGGGLVVMPAAFHVVNRELIVALAARYGVPAIYFKRGFAQAGGLIAFGPDYAGGVPPAAGYIDRILKGEKPGDLPVQAPTKFDLIINLKTAKSLGLQVPLYPQQVADELIE
jgi:putative tryptophan/tyrosine transport system substrate-binding protein